MSSWREWIGRAALPLLALPASWGVYQFQLLFIPPFVAALAALAFEAVYLGMAVAPTHSPRRAAVISAAAVIVSAVYNALASARHLSPTLFDAPSLAGVGLLALLHGAPLAVLAYAVASHLLHAPGRSVDPQVASLQAELAECRQQLRDARRDVQLAVQIVNQVSAPVDTAAQELRALVDSGVSVSQAARQVGVSRSTAHKKLRGT